MDIGLFLDTQSWLSPFESQVDNIDWFFNGKAEFYICVSDQYEPVGQSKPRETDQLHRIEFSSSTEVESSGIMNTKKRFVFSNGFKVFSV